jgi:hypothetical protein
MPAARRDNAGRFLFTKRLTLKNEKFEIVG